jgi:hypothetical protein
MTRHPADAVLPGNTLELHWPVFIVSQKESAASDYTGGALSCCLWQAQALSVICFSYRYQTWLHT